MKPKRCLDYKHWNRVKRLKRYENPKLCPKQFCSTPGCNGRGNVVPKRTFHYSSNNCPHSDGCIANVRVRSKRKYSRTTNISIDIDDTPTLDNGLPYHYFIVFVDEGSANVKIYT